MTPRTARPLRIAVAGAGMAAARLAQQTLAQAPPGTVRITLYGREARAPYNRTLLTGVLTGRYAPAGLALPTGTATVHRATDVVAFDPAVRTLRTSTGETAPYDVLVLATGAEPVLPAGLHPHGTPGTGHDAPLRGVHTLRTLDDCARLGEDARHAGRAVVVGGGVLGVGTALALAARGLPVHLLHRAPHLMEHHLDAGAAATVRRGLEEAGVRVRTGHAVTALHGGRRVTGAELADGSRHDADLAVLACGVRPRTALARAAGLPVRTGIVVDDRLATSAPGVYAIGDCAEHRGTVHGRAEAAWEQADVLAARLSGARPQARYRGSFARLRLRAGALDVAALGDCTGGGGPDTDSVRLADATRGTYKKLVLRGSELVGALLVGDLTPLGDLTDACERGEPVPPDPLHLLMTEGASP
ncbi:FAD-dependent oxidoreductase [Streptomyces sp. SCA3-4]|uniref:NAD(P)/FAD-dependent oxidoreductase n=1 Tax=Streptomyces sichuanensis TaxID=2871810 RepID=UPI001CE2BCA1|nr:FAD-dependent oxidoreductase [Streptomyces sichuanensis]MCA6096183.1 FAD-dependent oxidoreductase [Streptomyces sichuanensis]